VCEEKICGEYKNFALLPQNNGMGRNSLPEASFGALSPWAGEIHRQR
jgi:hypothetical protein